jgi:hypothetical protein
MQQLNRCHGLIGLTVVDIPTTRPTDNRLNDIDSLKMVNIFTVIDHQTQTQSHKGERNLPDRDTTET